MSYLDKIQEYKKLAKRANVRISALKANHAEQFIIHKEALNAKGKFYEGTKFNDEKELNRSLEAVKDFLNGTTTITKVKKTGLKNNIIVPTFDYETLKKMPQKDKIEEVRKLSQLANSRIKRLRSKGIDYYAMEGVNNFLDKRGRDLFYTGHKYDSKTELRLQLQAVTNFLNAKSSTLTGIKNIRKNRIDTFKQKLGVDVTDIMEEKKFFEFLSSNQFEALARKGDSEDIIEDFVSAVQQGFTAEEVQEQYKEYQAAGDDITFEEIQELRDNGYFFKN